MQDLALAQAMPAVTSPSLTEDSSSQGNIMENTSNPTPSAKPAAASPKAQSASRNDAGSSASAKPAGATGARLPVERPGSQVAGKAPAPAFKIRYGRTALAVAGLAALLTAVIAGALSLAGIAPAYLPIVSFLVAVTSVAALRTLAIRDRSKRSARRVDNAFRAAMNPGTTAAHAVPAAKPGAAGPAQQQAATKAAAPKRDTKLFDAESVNGEAGEGKAVANSSTSEAKTGQAALTAEDLRKAALEVAAESGETPAEGPKPAEEPKPTWQPVELPKPKYVESAKAERPVPEPLDLPAEPKPEGKPSIKSGAVAPKVEVKVSQDKTTDGENASSKQSTTSKTEGAKPGTGLNNLDDVLQRRRA
ncbi:hypothetical protein GCM10027402_33590 [Arthrobacter monumenti]